MVAQRSYLDAQRSCFAALGVHLVARGSYLASQMFSLGAHGLHLLHTAGIWLHRGRIWLVGGFM